MNKKNKVLLSTVGLLLLSGIAATSSTFAWFTTVRSASINYSEATAYTDSGNLLIKFVASETTMTADTEEKTNELELTGVNKITDISGDGVDFFKPVWASQTDHLDGVASEINDVTAADDYYIDFTIEVSRDNDAAANGLRVFLGAGTAFTDTTGNAFNVVPALRLAVLDDAGAVILRWAPVEETEDPVYLAEAATGTEAYDVDGFELVDDAELLNGDVIATETTLTDAAANGFEVADLSDETSAEITFRAWIEGTDSDTDNDLSKQKLSLAINLYALEVLA